MKLHFEPDLDFQHDAIEAVCDLFQGQEINRTEFTVSAPAEGDQLALGVHRGRPRLRQPPRPPRRRAPRQPPPRPDPRRPATLSVAHLGRLHGRDGDRHGQDLRLPPHHPQPQQALRLHQVHHRRPVGRHQGGRRSRRSRSPRTTSAASTPGSPTSTSSTTPPSSARSAPSPPRPRSRSWSRRSAPSTRPSATTSTRTREKTGGERPIDLIRAHPPHRHRRRTAERGRRHPGRG